MSTTREHACGRRRSERRRRRTGRGSQEDLSRILRRFFTAVRTYRWQDKEKPTAARNAFGLAKPRPLHLGGRVWSCRPPASEAKDEKVPRRFDFGCERPAVTRSDAERRSGRKRSGKRRSGRKRRGGNEWV